MRVAVNVRLSTRLIVRFGVPAALLFAGALWYSTRGSTERVIEQTEALARSTARYHAARLDRSLSQAAEIPAMHARVLESGVFKTEEALHDYLRRVVEASPAIYGSCLAFEPGAFTPGRYFYAPYYYRKADGTAEFVQVGNPEYNHFKWDWYRLPKETGRALWTEPFFDEGGGDVLMTTRTEPFQREGKFQGVATIDIALQQLMDEAAGISVAETGYAFIVSRQGRYLAFPDKARVMKATVQESNPELGRLMMAGDDGFRKTREPLNGREAWIAFAPVQNGGFSLALVYPRAEVLGAAYELQKQQLALGGIGLAALFVALYVGARSISAPITQLAAAAQRVAEGNLDTRIEVRAPTEEVRHLALAFNKMTRDLQMRMQELRYTTTVKERIEGELNAARSIQMSLLPKRFPAFPDRREIDIHALVKPAREVGGDLYDFYFIDEDWLCFLIGDVSGKGIPAALFMAVTKTMLKANSSRTSATAQMIAKVNDELCEETDSGMFTSLLYALLNVRTGQLEYCNAGHPPPLLLAASGAVSEVHGARNVALGALPGLNYAVETRHLVPGDAVFLYTDGVTEALNTAEEFYTAQRLHTVLHDLGALGVERITRGVVQDLKAFCGEREQADDISVLAIRWHGPATSKNN